MWLNRFLDLNNKLGEKNESREKKKLGAEAKRGTFPEGEWTGDGFANVLTSVILVFSDKHHMNDFPP